MTEDERVQVIRECIAALPKVDTAYRSGHNAEVTECVMALEALLPDPAKALQALWEASPTYEDWVHQRDPTLLPYDVRVEDEKALLRWLIATGRIKP